MGTLITADDLAIELPEGGEVPVRRIGLGPAELRPAHGGAGPVAAAGQVGAEELLGGHGGARHRLRATVVRQARAGGHAGTGEDHDAHASITTSPHT